MIANIYVQVDSYGEVALHTETEHRQHIQDYFEEDTAEGLISEEFEEFLAETYTPAEVFNMDEQDKEGVAKNYQKFYFKNFDTNYHWEKFEVELSDEDFSI